MAAMAQANLFAWNQRSSIRIPAIEEQHRELLGFLTTLAEDMSWGERRDAQNLLLLRFIDYAVYHFKKEAELIEKYGYDEYLSQYKNEQNLLVREFDDVRRKVRSPHFALDAATLILLKNVLRSHILSGEKYLVRRTGKA